jgi:hypothetical protein
VGRLERQRLAREAGSGPDPNKLVSTQRQTSVLTPAIQSAPLLQQAYKPQLR